MNSSVLPPTEVSQKPFLKFVLPIRRLTVSEYHRMVEAGILSEDEQVELIDGVIVQMDPQQSKHSAVISRMASQFYQLALEGKTMLRVQTPIILTDDTEPEPDLALVNPHEDAYAEAHPFPHDALLLIEVSDTSLEFDKEIKLPRYAASEIPEVWIVNLIDNRIEVYREPIKLADGGTIYRTRTDCVKGDTLTPQAISSLKISVDDVLI
jgi:Uma2 family endonuclease